MEIETVDKAIDLFTQENLSPAEIPLYFMNWLPEGDSVSILHPGKGTPRKVVYADYVEVPICVKWEDREKEAEKFVDYLIDNAKDLGIKTISGKIKFIAGNYRYQRYKKLLVKEGYLVMPVRYEVGLGLLDISEVKLLKE